VTWVLLSGLLIDALVGEPRFVWSRVPHPVVLVGKFIQLADERINKGVARKAKGIFFLCFLVASGGVLGRLIGELGAVVNATFVAILLAQRSLVDHVNQVAASLRVSLEEGRQAVGLIVGRDTRRMQESEVASAAIETAAENFSDGVMAPIFWFLIAGLPGLFVYKCVNTADSMIGYKTARHKDFGWGAAKFDDLLNWVPARVSALMLATTGKVLHRARQIKRDAKLHRSPNAGWPEAAMAFSLNVAIAGPRSYEGEKQNFAWVNEGGNVATACDIERSTRMLWSCWALAFASVCIISIFSQ